jgi:hypothetical protein
MDERAETERMAALSWREKLSKLLRIRSNRVSGRPDTAAEESSTTITAPTEDVDIILRSRRQSGVDFPIEYVPQFETSEIRIINEECPGMETEPSFFLQPDVHIQARVPPSTSARTVRSTMSQIVPNADNKFRSLFQVWDTRLSMKLFGSKNGIRKEEERRVNCKHFIIHPCSMFR